MGLTFALATYEGEDAQLYRCQIDGATLTPSISLEATSDNPGPVVIGFIPTVWRLLMGYDIRLDTSQLSPTAQQALATLRQPVNYFTMELQDAIDFSRFLANTTILMQRFSYGEPAIVGGVIEIAVVLEDDSRFLHRKEVKA